MKMVSGVDLADFTELQAVSGPLEHGDTCSCDLFPGETKTFISFLNHNGDCLLYVEYNKDTSVVSVSLCYNGNWTQLIDRLINKKIKRTAYDGVQLTVLFGEVTKLFLDSQEFFSIAMDYSNISRICGLGGIRNFRFQKQREQQFRESMILTALPDRDLSSRQYHNLIFDIGLHNGNDSEFYLKKGFNVIAVEANPHLCKAAAIRFMDEIAEGRMHILNMGLSDHDGVLPFYVCLANSEQSSFDEKLATRLGPVKIIEVPVFNGCNLFRSFGIPYYVKIDIEALDTIVLDVILALKHKPKYLSFETASPGWANYLEQLAHCGYSRFKIVNQNLVHKMTLPIPAKEGKTISHQFARGSSGPFGEETPGNWMSSQETLLEFVKLEKKAKSTPPSDWYDIHVGL